MALAVCQTVFPAALRHLFSGELVSGESAVDNLKNFAQYPARLRTFAGFAVHGLKAAIYTALICVGTLCGVFPRLQAASFDKRLNLDWLVFILPAFVTFVLVAVISPVLANRELNLFRRYRFIPCETFSSEEVSELTAGRDRAFDFTFLRRIEKAYLYNTLF